jgi:SAM-dependent methyltransferase
MSDPSSRTEFDRYAQNYDEALTRGISVSGEDKEFFARERVAWLAGGLVRGQFHPKSVLDFGTGTGSATPHLLNRLRAERVTGVDVSAGLLDVARREHGAEQIQFVPLHEHRPRGDTDLAFCNGVFHHIPPTERAAAVNHVFRSLRPGGLFALWENNPWNPGTRYVMSRIPFDRDAIPLSAPSARALLRAGGFDIVSTHFLFLFPHGLRWLRWSEPLVCRLPLGAQYQVLARKP